MVYAGRVLIAIALSVGVCLSVGDDDLTTARRQFELHNYKVSLAALERYEAAGGESGSVDVQTLRARCLLKLRRWDEGVAAMERLLAVHPSAARRPELHTALAEAGKASHRHRYLAVKHFAAASELYAAAGDAESAADAAIACGLAYVHFNDWARLDDPPVAVPSDWRASRRLQRRLAVEWIDRGVSLTADRDKAAAAVFAKAKLFHQSLRLETGDADRAMDVYRDLAARWPGSREAPRALLEVGRILERHHQDYLGAADQYRRVMDEYGSSQAARRAAESLKMLVTPVIRLGVEGVTPPGVRAGIDLETRNTARVSFRAYRVDLFDLVREIGRLSALDGWTERGKAAAEWSVEVPDSGEHKVYRSQSGQIPPTALPVTEPGAYLVVAESGPDAESARTRALVLVSRLGAVTKGHKGGASVWAVDALDGHPRSGVRVLVQKRAGRDRYDYRDGVTDERGFFQVGAGGGKRGSGAAIYLRDGPNFAICDASFSWYWWGYPNDYRVYAFTDRPVYRPDQVIHFKQIVRRYDAGDYHNAAGTQVELTVYDPKGQVAAERLLTTNAHGSVSGDLSLPVDTPLGVYRMQVAIGGRAVGLGRGGAFRVEEYRKPEFELTVEAAHARYGYGEPVDVRIEARYYFGSPVPEAKLTYVVYSSPLSPPVHYPGPYPWYFEQLRSWWSQGRASCLPRYCFMPWMERKTLVERGELVTGADGVAMLRIHPAGGDEASGSDAKAGYRYTIEVEATDASRQTVTGRGVVNVTRAPFSIQLTPQRRLYQPGDVVQIDIESRDANGGPVAFAGRMAVHRLSRREAAREDGSVDVVYELGERVFEGECSADASGVTRFRRRAEVEGPFRLVLTATAEDGTPVQGSCDVWITERGGRFAHYAYGDVELIPDRFEHEVGETARVLVSTRFDDAWVWLTVEADDLLDARLVHVERGSAVVELPIETMHTPNFYMTATLLRDHKVYQDMQAIVVPPTERFLTVGLAESSGGKGVDQAVTRGADVTPTGRTYLPGEEVSFNVTTADASGRPVDAEVALMMVDASLYYVQEEFRERVQEFFYGQTRPQLVSTRTSFDRVSGGVPVARGMFGDMRMAKTMAPQAMAATESAATADGGPGGAFATAEIRRDFPDSVVWVGHLETGADGVASIDVTFPDSLTTWRLIAVAVDDQTRVGEASLDAVTRKPVIARLHAPRFLVEGDVCRVTVIARNDLARAKTVRVSLAASGPVTLGAARRGGEIVDEATPHAVDVVVAAGGEVAIDFDVSAERPGAATFTATAATDVSADAVERKISVTAFGARQLLAQGGVIRGEASSPTAETVRFTLPSAMDRETPILEVHLNPTIAGVMLDAIPYLLDYPYGCVEQTMSRFLPAVVTRRTLERLDVRLKDLAGRLVSDTTHGGPADWSRRRAVFDDGVLLDIVTVGLQRLGEMQRGDGGWGWWSSGPPDAYMTAYVVYGLAEAVRSGVAVDATMLERGVGFLDRWLADPAGHARGLAEADSANVRMWVLYALSVAEPGRLGDEPARGAIEEAFADRDALTDYTRAMLALVLHTMGDRARALTVIENLENTVHVDAETGTASWGWESGYVRWYRNGLESTAMVLRALVAVRPDHPRTLGAVNWLVRQRRGGRWHSTKDTAFAIYALADYLTVSGELEPDMTVTVTYDGGVRREFRITRDNVLTFDARMIFASEHLSPGEHTVRIEREGRGHVYYSTYVDFYTREDPIEAAGREVRVTRRYARLIPKEVERTRPVWDAGARQYVQETYAALDYDREALEEGRTVASGDLIEVSLVMQADSAFDYIVVEDPKPAGCEPVTPRSGFACGGGVCSNVELRDRLTAFFVGTLPGGEHTLTYRLRCETPGRFGALPTRLDAMYSPYLRANGSSRRLDIVP